MPLGYPKFGPKVRNSATAGFRVIESGLLISIALLTLGAALIEFMGIWRAQTITLADILLMFLYTEVIGMVAVFYTRLGSPFVYPIFIAITALSRLIVLQGKENGTRKYRLRGQRDPSLGSRDYCYRESWQSLSRAQHTKAAVRKVPTQVGLYSRNHVFIK